MAYRYYKSYRQYNRNYAAEKHIREAGEFSTLVGGADREIKEYFFSLGEESLHLIFVKYGGLYGLQAKDYAQKTYLKWKNGQVQMSGIVAKRLFNLLPPIMDLSKKYEIAQHIWEYSSPCSNLYLLVRQDTPLSTITNKVHSHLSQYTSEHMIPEAISNSFKWLSESDVVIYEQLLNYFRNQEFELAVTKIQSIIPTLQRQASQSGVTINELQVKIPVQKHNIYIKIDNSIVEPVRETDVFRQFNAKTTPPWIRYIIIALLVYLFFKYIGK